MNLDQWLRRKCCLRIFHILSSGSPFVQWSVNFCAISVEGIKRNNSENYFEFGSVVQEQMSFKIFLTGSLGNPPVQLS